MKFLQVVTLFAILVEYATASNDNRTQFHYAVKKGILATAVELYEQDKSLGKLGIDYVVKKSNSTFIAKFINQTGQANEDTLRKLCKERSVGIIRKVLEKVDFPQKDLVKATAYHASQCHIKKLLVLLKKIETPERQESVVESSIGHVLYRCSTDRFYSFLNALKRKSLLSGRLENDATQSAFKEGVRRNREDLLKRTFEHPAITPGLYADALIESEKYLGSHKLTREWLLERADLDDLMTVQGRNGYKDMRPKFRVAIDEALKIAQPGEAGIHDIQSAEMVEEAFKELGYFRESEEPVDLISAYLGVDKPIPRRKTKKTANWIRLREVIDRRELVTAVKLYKRDALLHYTGIEYVIEKQFPDFIISFAKHAYKMNDHILNTLCRKGSKETIENVLEKVDFSQDDLVEAASFQGLIREPERFIVLINKIIEPERQESVVESSIGHVLYRCSTDRFYSFLNALKRKSLLSERLEAIAIQMAFKEGVESACEDLLERTSEHPAITPEIYSDGLIEYEKYTKHSMFQWLLKRADRIDLQEVQGKEGYASRIPEFHVAIVEALETAQPGGTRTHDIQRVERVEEIFEELGYFREPEDPTKLISAYLGVDTLTPRRKAKEAAKEAAREAANWIRLRGVIDRRELETAVVLYKGDKLLHHKGMDYVIENQFPDFIISFIRHAYEANSHILVTLCKKGSKETIENVLEKVNFPQKDLIGVASEGNVVCHLPKFLMLLNKITTPEGQESVITNGMNALIREKSTECINPMLDALKDKTFRSEHLEAIAIRIVFKEGVKFNREDLLERTFDHPAITPALYADALIESEKSWESCKLTREWLLERADRDDLQAVNGNDGYADLILPFRTAIENALEIAKPGGTRTRAYDIQSAKKTKEEFMEIEHDVAISGIAKIIGEYLAGKEDEERGVEVEVEVEGPLQEQEEEIDWGEELEEGEEAELGEEEDEEGEWGDI